MNSSWADDTGLPTRHSIQAALRVAALIDPQGSPLVNARETYRHVASGGTLPPPDLAMGEELLVYLGLAIVTGGIIHRTPLLEALLDSDADSAAASIIVTWVDLQVDRTGPAMQHVQARITECVQDKRQQEDAVAVVAARFDDTHRRLVGDIGEEIVVNAARRELFDAGHHELSAVVRRVSLVSDAYGYDIVAPRVHDADRLLEVKATTRIADGTATIYLSRHEADVGSQRDNWMLVLCHVIDIEQRRGVVVGWASHRDIGHHLPTDSAGGRWVTASMRLDLKSLVPGLPSAFT